MPTIAGREISVKKLNEAQVMLIMREGQVLRSDKTDTERRMKGIATILNIVESAIEDVEDLEYVLHQTEIGKVEFQDLLKLVVPESDETAAPRTVRRAATRK